MVVTCDLCGHAHESGARCGTRLLRPGAECLCTWPGPVLPEAERDAFPVPWPTGLDWRAADDGEADLERAERSYEKWLGRIAP